MTSSPSNPKTLQGQRYWKRRDQNEDAKPERLIIPVVIACLAIFIGGLISVPKQIEHSVRNAVVKTLSRVGLGELTVQTDGQDVYIAGQLSADRLSSEIPKLHAIAKGVTCDVALLGDVICPAEVFVSIEEQAATRTSLREAETNAGTALPAGVNASALTDTTFHNFFIEKDREFISINGEMPNPKMRDLMLRRGTKYGLAVIDEMAVTRNRASDYFAWAVERAWVVVQYLESGQVKWVDGKFSVDGQITSDDTELVEKAYKSDFFNQRLAGINLDVRPVYNDAETCNQAFADVLSGTKIEFAPESAKISSSSEVLLDRIAVLAEQCTLSFVVENHTEDSGDNARDLALSQGRAEAVKNALIDRGINESRLTAQGFGGTKPLQNNNTPVAWMLNRRTNIVAKQ